MGAASLRAWTSLAPACRSFQDACLQQAEAQHLTRLPITFAYTVKGVDMSGGRTHLASGTTEQEVLTRLNWGTVLQQLQ